MMEKTVVTINIPTYNQEKYIKKTINSVLNQTYEDFQINISDDCSTDNTIQIANSILSKKLNVYKNDYNIGRVKNYQKLLNEYSNGKWVINLDGDDKFSNNNFIKYAIDCIKSNISKYDITLFQGNHGNLEAVKKLKTVIILDENSILVNGLEYLLNYHKINFFSHFATMYNTERAKELNFYAFDSLNTDFNSIMKLASTGYIIVSKIEVGKWNFNASSETNKIKNEAEFKKYFDAILDIAEFIKPRITEIQFHNFIKELNLTTANYLFYLATSRNDISFAKKMFHKFKKIDIRSLKQFLKLIKISLK